MKRLSANATSDLPLSLLPAPTAAESAASDGVDLLLDSRPPESISHALFMPLHYEENYSYPLLIWLHSDGDNETQLRRIMPLVSLRNYVAAAPRGTQPENRPDGLPAFCWRQHCGDIADANQRVQACIQLARGKCNIHPRRVFLAGYAAGGTMAMRVAMQSPELFAGAASIGGPLPRGNAPLARINDLRSTPFCLMHGSEGRDYPVNQVCVDLRLLHTAGMCTTVRQYPCEDDLTTQMLRDLDAWIMEQVTGLSAEEPVAVSHKPGQWN